MFVCTLPGAAQMTKVIAANAHTSWLELVGTDSSMHSRGMYPTVPIIFGRLSPSSGRRRPGGVGA